MHGGPTILPAVLIRVGGQGFMNPKMISRFLQKHRHQVQKECRVMSMAIPGNLHHEYWLEKIAA